jgi:hypothetical protein
MAFVDAGANPEADVVLFKRDPRASQDDAPVETLGMRVEQVIRDEANTVAKSAGTNGRDEFVKVFVRDENREMREVACSALARLPVDDGLEQLDAWVAKLDDRERASYLAALRRLR